MNKKNLKWLVASGILISIVTVQVIYADDQDLTNIQTESSSFQTIDSVVDTEETIDSSETITKMSESEIQSSLEKDDSSSSLVEDGLESTVDSIESTETINSEEKQITETDNHVMGQWKNYVPSMTRTVIDQFQIGDNNYTKQDAIDIASYQSWMNATHFQNLYKLGIKAAVVKTTEGTTYLNPEAKKQINNAKKAGMNVSVYHYAQFNDAKTGYEEGQYAASKLNALGLNKDILIFADMEDK